MAGIFGDTINSREDFFAELNRALELVDKVLGKAKSDPTIQSVKQQLLFMKKCSADGREPTIEERWSVDAALRLQREYEVIDDWDDLYDLKEIVEGLENYFNYWPSDELAADEENDERIDFGNREILR